MAAPRRSLPFRTAGRLLRRSVWGALALAGALGLAAQEAAPPAEPARVLTVAGAISPAMADYIIRNIAAAEEAGAPLLVLKMDTPGGLETSMRDINRAILAAEVPVATWVAPAGARAASAGTFILYASHVAAMAPATSLGAATPVAIGGGGEGGGEEGSRSPFPFGSPSPGGEDRPAGRPAPAEAVSGSEDAAAADGPETGAPGTDAPSAAPLAEERPAPRAPRSAMEAKAVNDAVAYIRGLAELRGRDADFAERAVREAATLTAAEAAARGVIDFTAANLSELFAKADGKVVTLGEAAREVTLATAGIAFTEIEPDWRTALLAVITNPNVALILMLLGVYGIIFEFLNPGVLVPGTVGGISLILGLYALALLPLNWAGAGLVLLGLALIVAEAFAPSFGILGIGGTVALVVGLVMLVDTEAPGLDISIPLVAGVAVAGVISTFIVAWLARRAFAARIVSGAEELIGAAARVTDWQGGTGHVWLHGERWRAEGAGAFAPGEKVRVTALDGLTLKVERAG